MYNLLSCFSKKINDKEKKKINEQRIKILPMYYKFNKNNQKNKQ